MKLRRVCLQTTTAETGQFKLGNAQERRCAGAAPWSSINLLTHTGSIMSPPSFLPPSCLVRRVSLSLPPSVSLQLSLTVSPSNSSTPVFLFCISQQSPGQASGTQRQHQTLPRSCLCLSQRSPASRAAALQGVPWKFRSVQLAESDF